MNVIDAIAARQEELAAWRHDLHAHPEIAFEEHRTAGLVAQRLESFGLEVHRGLARTGVVGVLRAGSGRRMIGLRADMDALPIEEAAALPYRSRHPGKMHACGHDGHTVMLLAAARALAQAPNFDGAVAFIFQPAEENEGGGRAMVEDGLFERFPCESVYGMHNIPGIPAGRFGVMPGPMMASYDVFEIAVVGKGTHAAMPHHGVDPILAASQLVTALNTIASRAVDPLDAAVLSVTQIAAGDTWNVIPETATVKGTVRCFSAAVQDAIEAAMRRMVETLPAAYGARASLRYERRYPPTVNTAPEAAVCAEVLDALVGPANVSRDARPLMAAEDFAFMLQARPGAYVWIGNGTGSRGGCMVHNPGYDFNDDILVLGASYWVRLVERLLPARGAA